jgi:hypothetical protein
MSDDKKQNFKSEDAGNVFIFAEDRIYELGDGRLERSAPAKTWFPHPDLGQAIDALTSPRQAATVAAWQDIDHELGLDSSEHFSAVGTWKSGVDPCAFSIVTNASREHLRLSAAMIGHLTNQKQVLIFLEGDGDSALLTFQMPLIVQSTHRLFANYGVSIQTLQPVGQQTTAFIFSQDHNTTEAASAAGSCFGVIPDARSGAVELIGAAAKSHANAPIRYTKESLKEHLHKLNIPLPPPTGKGFVVTGDHIFELRKMWSD